jgi:hypothetical protein
MYACNVHSLTQQIAFLLIDKANNHHQSNESTNDDNAEANGKTDATADDDYASADYAGTDIHSNATTVYAEADIRSNATTNGEYADADIQSNTTTDADCVSADI